MDKGIVIRAEEVFREGLILEHGTLVLTEKDFACMFFTDSLDKLDSEIPRTDFPQYRPQLVELLTKHRDTVALSGDKLGRKSAIEHEVNLEKGRFLLLKRKGGGGVVGQPLPMKREYPSGIGTRPIPAKHNNTRAGHPIPSEHQGFSHSLLLLIGSGR